MEKLSHLPLFLFKQKLYLPKGGKDVMDQLVAHWEMLGERWPEGWSKGERAEGFCCQIHGRGLKRISQWEYPPQWGDGGDGRGSTLLSLARNKFLGFSTHRGVIATDFYFSRSLNPSVFSFFSFSSFMSNFFSGFLLCFFISFNLYRYKRTRSLLTPSVIKRKKSEPHSADDTRGTNTREKKSNKPWSHRYSNITDIGQKFSCEPSTERARLKMSLR